MSFLERRRRLKFSLRPFYVIVLVISALSILSLIADQSARYGGRTSSAEGLQRRGLETLRELRGVRTSGLLKRDEECRLVHHAKDKCAFILENCPDEEAGLFSYLSLYYCKLPTAQPVALLIMVLWLALLFTTIGIAASDFFCVNLSTISGVLGMSESMAGVTFLAFGNGSPDVFSTFAAMSTHSGSLAVGELIGAAGFITAVVAGSMAIVRPFKVAKRSFVRDVGFFIFSASFSIGFLADGRLQLWECILMVTFYSFYVVFVVTWHWWLGRRRKRREREAVSRDYYIAPGSEDVEHSEVDEEDEDVGTNTERRSLLRHGTTEDFGALERGRLSPSLGPRDEDEEEDERETEQERWLADINSSMRVGRRPKYERRSTINPIRPSLVGALEFRAVLSSLQRARSTQAVPLTQRRYSDDPNLTAEPLQNGMPPIIDEGVEPSSESDSPHINLPEQSSQSLGFNGDPGVGARRARAVSTNDAIGLRLDPNDFSRNIPDIDLLSPTPPGTDKLKQSEWAVSDGESASHALGPPSPTISVSPPESQEGSRRSSEAQRTSRTHSLELLAPPQEVRGASLSVSSASTDGSYSPRSKPTSDPLSKKLPQIIIPHEDVGVGGTSSTFPPFFDSPLPMTAPSGSRSPSMRFASPSISRRSSFCEGPENTPTKPLSWWPYSVLPPPNVIVEMLFPTLHGFRQKNVFEKLLGLLTAPSIFLLTITLPVVDSEADDDEPEEVTPADRGARTNGRRESRVNFLPGFEPTRNDSGRSQGHRHSAFGVHDHHHDHHNHLVESPQPGVMHSIEEPSDYFQPKPSQPQPQDTNIISPISSQVSPASTGWNRWLVAIQILTAPLFVVLIVWANTAAEDPPNPRGLIRPVLFALLAGLVALSLLLITTTPEHPPKWRFLLCFLGFAVSIAWISTIAGEVVGVLKAVGVILGISDAILGLTIFAVGNSLGDLVADVTVARLGFPVMALSACFGGPMLNILLGIGLSGIYIMIRDGKHWAEKHPHKHIKYKPYEIQVSSTLMISAATLLVTLIGLLIVVPLNKWMMDRRIGWALIALWSLSTIGNVIVELTGAGGTWQ